MGCEASRLAPRPGDRPHSPAGQKDAEQQKGQKAAHTDDGAGHGEVFHCPHFDGEIGEDNPQSPEFSFCTSAPCSRSFPPQFPFQRGTNAGFPKNTFIIEFSSRPVKCAPLPPARKTAAALLTGARLRLVCVLIEFVSPKRKQDAGAGYRARSSFAISMQRSSDCGTKPSLSRKAWETPL